MAILAGEALRAEIASGRITIDPYDPGLVGPASVDLRLGSTFRAFRPARRVVRVDARSDYRDTSEKVVLGDGETLLLMPQETLLGLTIERIRLAPDLCGWLEGRSRFARIGLLVHISAGFMQPGLANHQVLELTNFGPNPLELVPGTPICQFIFQRTEGSARYAGTFADQDGDAW
ncbi:MAG: dCTP deaminase [Myxococcota bacterium]